jgi:O-antigen/teichoic acid export membrane protein
MGNLFKSYYNRFWHSPTLMTWLSYSTKALSLFVALPLILKKFTPAEISLWYLFSSIFILLGLADMGFRQTFIRVISYAVAGASEIKIYNTGQNNIETENSTNWKLLEEVFSIMSLIYRYLSLILFFLLITVGTYLLLKPVSLVDNQKNAWIAWIIIIVTNVIRFYGTIFQNYLEGLNKIALVRKIESFMNLGSITTSIIVLLMNGDILSLIIANQIWLILNVIRNWLLARIVEQSRLKSFKSFSFDLSLFNKIWPPAWKTGISGLMSNGLTHLSGILYAQIGDPVIISSYLLALRIMTQIKEISMAPFYSKIPYLSRLRAEGRMDDLINISQKGMRLSHFIFVSGVLFIGFFSDYFIGLIQSNIDFVSPLFWFLFSLAFFVHRYGAMHMQLYLTTNHIIAHIADGVSGLIFIIVAFLSVQSLGIYAIPLAMLCGYLGFYAWYSVVNSLRSIQMSFLKFEISASLIPLSLLMIFIFIKLCLL